jgi:hypothetical protein
MSIKLCSHHDSKIRAYRAEHFHQTLSQGHLHNYIFNCTFTIISSQYMCPFAVHLAWNLLPGKRSWEDEKYNSSVLTTAADLQAFDHTIY